MFNNTDREWEKFGATEPYFGVFAADEFRKSNMTSENQELFFRSGHDYINDVLNNIRRHIDPNFSINKALDFGCGVGRLVIPLAVFAEKVVGVDISESMLNEAKSNCESRYIKNVFFVKSDDNLSLLNEKYNFIHSVIVFQHIRVERGEHIFERLLTKLEDEGICVVHFTYAKSDNSKKLIFLIRNYVPLAENLINLIKRFKNLIKGKSFSAPQMQMNSYNLNRLFFLMQRFNIKNFYTEFTDHGGELGVILYFRKP